MVCCNFSTWSTSHWQEAQSMNMIRKNSLICATSFICCVLRSSLILKFAELLRVLECWWQEIGQCETLAPTYTSTAFCPRSAKYWPKTKSCRSWFGCDGWSGKFPDINCDNVVWLINICMLADDNSLLITIVEYNSKVWSRYHACLVLHGQVISALPHACVRYVFGIYICGCTPEQVQCTFPYCTP